MTVSYDKLPINQDVVLDLPCFEATGDMIHDVSPNHINMTSTGGDGGLGPPS